MLRQQDSSEGIPTIDSYFEPMNEDFLNALAATGFSRFAHIAPIGTDASSGFVEFTEYGREIIGIAMVEDRSA